MDRSHPRRRSGAGRLLVVLVVVAAVVGWLVHTGALDLGSLGSLGSPGGPGSPRSGAPGDPSAAPGLAPPATAEGPFRVERVVDGDTLIVTRPDGRTRVRVLGIDTPESVTPDQPVGCFGPEASARASELLAGASVLVAGDPTQARNDDYGRELDYVWLPDGRMLEMVLLEEGFALEYTYDRPYAHQRAFRDAEARARAAGVGLWSASTCGGDVDAGR